MRGGDVNQASAQRQCTAAWEGTGGLHGLRRCGRSEEDNKVIMGQLRIDIELGEGGRRKRRLKGRR